ncbi:hypothetical protein G7Y89_g7793 [Cudoniella acicularis]|uniref:FAD-binding domain-containing protein n=1 Tax=Cudoniella acicularis TaxID=354080 RepID=A0A8H4W475_9HELO|nr:hypothetical protein G7Y89_g7793 [Cudoniella acicularis]
MTPPKPHILITGAGIAGPVFAYFLTLTGLFRTTILERSPTLRKAGQQIDIRGPGLTIVKRMQLLDIINSKTTKEAGMVFVDGKGRRRAEFPVSGGAGFTSEIEILRGELVEILVGVTRRESGSEGGDGKLEIERDESGREGGGGKTEYIFGDHVTALEQMDSGVKVTLASGREQEFDLVIGADGMNSKTRRLAFPDIEDPKKSLGQYTAYFTISYEERDGTFAQWYNAPGGRCVFLRPDNAGFTRAYLSIMSDKPKGYEKMTIAEQKNLMRNLFEDAGWEAKRVLEAMETADDFYMQEIAQVKMPSWVSGRVALLGDAGYCPSPISGQGTTLAIVGAYILAGELGKCGGRWEEGLRGYEEKMRPFVKKAQKLFPGAPGIANPQTQRGINILYSVVGFVSWSGLPKVFSIFEDGEKKEDKSLPVYEF